MSSGGLGQGWGGGTGYSAADRGHRTDRWRTRGTDANAELQRAMGLLRARSRDLVRNNAWASAGVDLLESYVVGTGIRLHPRGDEAVAERAAELWSQWCKFGQCDADGVDDMHGLQQLVIRTVVESGSCLIRRRRRQVRDSDRLSVRLQLQILEPDHLDYQRQTGNGSNRVINGVEVDSIGRRVAYWLFQDHPGSSHPNAKRTTSKRIPADQICHVFLRKRGAQLDAAPWLTPVILRLRNLEEFEDGELLRMVIASSWAAFITTEDEPAPGEDRPEPIEDLQAGQVEYLRPGQSITFPSLPEVRGRDAYVSNQLLAVAACLGMPYQALVPDLTKVNFSSGRMGFNAFERRATSWRERLLQNQMMLPIWEWFREAAMVDSLLPAKAAELEVVFTPPGRMVLDPSVEGEADAAAVRNGLKTMSDVLRSHGKDPRPHLEEAARDFEMLDEFGLKLDLDPRHTAAAGAARRDEGGGEGGEGDPEKKGEELHNDAEDADDEDVEDS